MKTNHHLYSWDSFCKRTYKIASDNIATGVSKTVCAQEATIGDPGTVNNEPVYVPTVAAAGFGE